MLEVKVVSAGGSPKESSAEPGWCLAPVTDTGNSGVAVTEGHSGTLCGTWDSVRGVNGKGPGVWPSV